MENQLIREQVFDVLFNYVKIVDGIFTESDCATVRDEIMLALDQSQFTADEAEEHINQEVKKRIEETVAGKFIAVEIEKRIADRFPSKEEILKYFNNHFNCYTDVTIRDYETTEIAMTNIAVLKMFEWLRSRLTCSEIPNNSKTEGGGE